MAVVALRVLLIIILIGIVQARILKLNSWSDGDDLVSDGVDRIKNRISSSVNANSCDHQYGFLPCAENVGGYIFQMVVYQGLLIFGEKQIGRGSQVLFNIIGVGKIGGILFRILMSLPSMMLMIVSGVFSNKESAQSQVSIGVGIYVGMTVFSLTLQWGICVIFGSKDLPKEETLPEDNTEALSNGLLEKQTHIALKDTGVKIDKETQYTAGIMLLSLIPYIIVQLDDVVWTSSGTRTIILIGLIASSLSLIAYFIYQILNPWMQQRSLDYSRHEILRKGFLRHLEKEGRIVNEDGKLNTDVIKKLFSETDKDASKCLTKAEMEKLVLEIMETGKVNVDKSLAVSDVMKVFDFDEDSSISEEEFMKGCEKWIHESSQNPENNHPTSANIFHEICQIFKDKKEDDPREIDRIMSKILKHAETQLLKAESLVTQDGKLNTERIRTLFKKLDSDGNNSISASEVEQLISNVKFGEIQPNDIVKELFRDFDKNNNSIIDEPEFVEGVTRWLNKAIRVANTQDMTKAIGKFEEIVWRKEVYDKWAFMISVFQVLLGIVILTFLGGPLMVSILQLSYAMSMPSFCISFVIVPLAMLSRAAFAAVSRISHKSEKTASLTFSEIYGGVIMNNISGLTTLLAIVYAKDLRWDFSAEVLTVLVVCAVVGILAYTRKTYPLWTCILAIFLYPFSLGLFYFMQIFWSWN